MSYDQKLNPAKRAEIARLYLLGNTQTELAAAYGVSQPLVCRIVQGVYKMGKAESARQARIKEYLEKSGWEVKVTSQDKAVRKQLAGITDLIAVRNNVTLFCETKTPTGKLRQSQKDFRDMISRNSGNHLVWACAQDVYDVQSYLRNAGVEGAI